MKKLLLIAVVTAVLVVILPLIGNKTVQNELDSRVKLLVSNGIEVVKSDKKAGYFTTQNHYEFLVKDTDKFIKYLEQFSDKQLPPYVDVMLKGTIIGADIDYSNFLFSRNFAIDIYPLSLPEEIAQSIKKNDENFYKFIKSILESKGILYHINYDIANTDFDGYIKDIDKSYVLKDGSKITLNLSKVIFNGSGTLIAPSALETKIEKISLGVIDGKSKFNMDMQGFSSTGSFNSKDTYITTVKLKNIQYKISSQEDISFGGSDIYVEGSTNIQDKKAQFYLKSSFGNCYAKTKDMVFEANGFNYDAILKDIDKSALEELRMLLLKTKTNNQYELNKKIGNSIIKLFSKGMIFDIANLSLKNFTIKDKKDIAGFNIKAKVVLKADDKLSDKIKKSSMALLENITLDSKMVFSKEMMNVIYEKLGSDKMIKNFALEDGNNIVFNIKYKDLKLSINDKPIR